jgi:hypothetical protein
MRMNIAVWAVSACVLLISVPAGADPDCWATGNAEMTSDPGYLGYWKYCYEINWSGLSHGASHLDVFILLEDCACLCTPGYFAFADTVGTGPGEGGCTVCYHASFLCEGDPTMANGLPTIKFEYFENGCEPAHDGLAYVCFYSVAAPIPEGTYEDAIGIKCGTECYTGCLTGVMPSCDTNASATENSTWGGVKALYR